MNTKRKILFITNRADYSGAEIVISQIIKHSNNKAIEYFYASDYEGDLFSLVGKKNSRFSRNNFEKRHFINANFSKIKLKFKGIKDYSYFNYIHSKTNADIWYINTIVNTRALEFAEKMNIKCIVHCHEMEQMLSYLSSTDVERLINYPEYIIANSESTFCMLQNLGRKEKLVHIPSPVDFNELKITMSKNEIRKELNIPVNGFLWIMIGYSDINKNPPGFVSFAKNVLDINPNSFFLWIGADMNNGLTYYAVKLSESLGIRNKIIWLPNQPYQTMANFINASDALVITSRKESLSLTMLESAYLGKPILSFDSGGPSEFIDSDVGFICGEYNFEKLALFASLLMANYKKFNPNKIKNTTLKYSIDNQILKWDKLIWEILQKTIH